MKILIVSLSPLHRDPRVLRQIRHLSQKHEVFCIGYSKPSIPGVKYIGIPSPHHSIIEKFILALLLVFRIYPIFMKRYYNQLTDCLNRLSEISFDLIIANDIDSLPAVIDNGWSHRSKILFDAHEYAPLEQEDELYWRILFKPYRTYLCKQYLKYPDAMITVSKGIADKYHTVFGVSPSVIPNASDYIDISPQPVNEKSIRIIHHGLAVPSRQIETMIDVMNYTDSRFFLDLMLIVPGGCERYYRKLKRLAGSMKSVKIIEPVPFQEIVQVSNRYDIGLFILTPTNNFNKLHVLPNKIFEFVQARLAIAVGPSPEMKQLVHKYDLGIVANDFSAKTMADILNRLTAADIMHYKEMAHRAARILSSESSMEILDQVISGLYPEN